MLLIGLPTKNSQKLENKISQLDESSNKTAKVMLYSLLAGAVAGPEYLGHLSNGLSYLTEVVGFEDTSNFFEETANRLYNGAQNENVSELGKRVASAVIGLVATTPVSLPMLGLDLFKEYQANNLARKVHIEEVELVQEIARKTKIEPNT